MNPVWVIQNCFMNILNHYRVRKNGVTMANNVMLNGACIFISDIPGTITVGEDTKINSGARYNQIGGDTRAIIRTIKDGKVVIGKNVGISNSALIAMNSIIIEDNVKIGGSCKIYDTDFHSLDYNERMQKPDPGIKSAPVYIKKGAFIGAHSIILKGVTIGEKAIIGAGSVVTKSIPDGEIWAGNPIKFKKRIESEIDNSD